MPDVKIVNCANNTLRKERKMEREMLKRKRQLVCPTCNTPVTVHDPTRSFRTCPRCGEWLAEKRRSDRKPGRAASPSFGDSPDWEQASFD